MLRGDNHRTGGLRAEAVAAEVAADLLVAARRLGGGGGRGGGGMFGAGSNTGRKYSLNFSVQALNLFNNIDYGGPNGGQPLDVQPLAVGTVSTSLAARRIFARYLLF